MSDYAIEQAEKEREEFLQSRQKGKSNTDSAEKKNYSAVLSIDDILNQPITEDKWLVESIVLSHGLTIFGGLPGHGKSWLSQFLAKSVASGEPFLGKFKVEQGSVLIVDREIPTQRLNRRWSSIGQLEKLPIFFYQYSDSFKLDNWEDVERLKELVVEKNVKLVIIDTFNRSHTGKDLSSAGDVATVFEPIKALLEHCSVNLIHHLNKGAYTKSLPSPVNLYGSIDFVAETDLLFAVMKNEMGEFVVHNLKSRDSEEIEPFFLKLETHLDGSVSLNYEGELQVKLSPTVTREQRIIEILKKGKTKREDLMNQLVGSGENEKTVTNTLTTLKKGKFISTERVRNEVYYFLPESHHGVFPDSQPLDFGNSGIVEEEAVDIELNASQWSQETSQEADLPACSACGGSDFWTRPDGGQVCSVCHPPVSSDPGGAA